MLDRLLVPTFGPSDWRRLLADPLGHWVRSKSAYEIAVSWESARGTRRGLPNEVAQILDSHDDLEGAELLLGIPEHRVSLPGGGHASQTDLWALLKQNGRLLSLAVEGKAGEPFDKTVGEWLADAKPKSGKPDRLNFLRERLGISEDLASIRYQLLHRTASAILEAERFAAQLSILLVQSFGGPKDEASFSEFRAFGGLFSVALTAGRLQEVKVPGSVRVFLGWVACPCAGEPELAAAV